MSIILTQLCMENYKLFSRKRITFEEALTVFDGPNGYGKTSTFDAIELLLTGKIERVNFGEVVSAETEQKEEG